MVVFTCNSCGDSLQKPKVEKHYSTVCKSAKNLTCVDCLKDFREEEYAAHNKCITEQERYAAKGTVTNVIGKGEAKQQHWSDMIENIIKNHPDVKGSQKIIFQIMSTQTANVPRKKLKFLNFIKNAGGNKILYPDIEKVWDLIEKYRGEQDSHNNTINELDTGLQTEEVQTHKKSKKDKTQANEGSILESENVEPPKKKKRKSKNIDTDAQTIVSNSKEQEAQISLSDKKKNKTKKRNSEDNLNYDENKTLNGGDSENVESKKKKKRKSKHIQSDAAEAFENSEQEKQLDNSETQNEQPNKCKKRKSDEKIKSEVNENTIMNVEKKKKRKSEEVLNNSSLINEISKDVSTEIKSKKKKSSNKFDHIIGNNNAATNRDSLKGKEETLETNQESSESLIKNDNNGDVTLNEDGNTSEAIIRIILKTLQKKDSVSVTKLQKKVMNEYFKETGVSENAKLVKKFNKQLKKMKGIEILNENVRLSKLDDC